ncbi:hypothetical protein [Nocardia sp. CA-120079]|uniref:RraA family protein n=1 Tax=Nocardia sp. CA-120079 TaxID=3239974 RepID=UPI003D979772
MIVTPELPVHLRKRLEQVGTATLTQLLQRRGISNTFMAGLRPIDPDVRMVGVARTLRYLPFRSDIAKTLDPADSAQRRAVEAIRPGDVLVIDARGVESAGTIGDIFALRVFQLGGSGVVTDGGVRDTGAVRSLGGAMFHRSSHGATLQKEHLPWSIDEAISCAGVFVQPGDIVVGDADGVVVVPFALAEEISAEALDIELADEWAISRVRRGEPTNEVFPIAQHRRAEFEEWKKRRQEGEH